VLIFESIFKILEIRIEVGLTASVNIREVSLEVNKKIPGMANPSGKMIDLEE